MILTALEWYKVLFALQLIVGEWLFLRRLERRPNFVWRMILGVTAIVAVLFLMPVSSYTIWYESALFFLIFIGSLLMMRLCFDESWGNLLFCGIAGYTVQHLAYLLYTFIAESTQMELLFGRMFNPYSDSPIDLEELPLILIVFYVCCYFIVYGFVFDIFDSLMMENRNLYLGRKNLIILSGLLIVADVIFNMITNHYTRGSLVSLLLERSYNILICILILALLYYQLTHREMSMELQKVYQILENGKKQHELAQKSIDLINMKYHDLRHQSELLQQKGYLAQEAKRELDGVLEDYALQADTGNNVLDTILTEKALLCQKQGITLTCIANGRDVDFVKAHHLYVLLGNAIENAMEAVAELPLDQREIHLSMREIGNMVNIHIENPYRGVIHMKNGIPDTGKKDKDFHGFGILSIRTIAEQYGGTVNINVTDAVFVLDILLLNRGSSQDDGDIRLQN